MSIPFHLAFSVKNIEKTKQFYVDILGCTITKAKEHWLNINFFGHQLSIHEDPHMRNDLKKIIVEDKEVPLHHFGVILKKKDWDDLASKLKKGKVKFVIEPKLKHEKQVCEQAIMFLTDPSGNGIEFKCFTDPKHIFGNC
jgi:extradiol dioxygenase family protein